jgi:hypothetical protein
MPELPEVEGARRLVERAAVGKRVVEAIVADDTSECGWQRHPDTDGRNWTGSGAVRRPLGPGTPVGLPASPFEPTLQKSSVTSSPRRWNRRWPGERCWRPSGAASRWEVTEQAKCWPC